MKKALTIIILSFITVISCNKNNNSTGSVGKVGEITIDPTQTTPLSALYTKDSVNTAPVTVTVKGQYGEEDLVHTYPAGYGTEFPIHGMYPEIENTIIVNDGGMIKEQKHNPGVIYFSDNTVLNKYYEMEINKLQEDTDYKNNPSIYLLYTVPQNDAVGISKNGYTRYILKQYSASKAVIDNNEIVFYAHKGQAN